MGAAFLTGLKVVMYKWVVSKISKEDTLSKGGLNVKEEPDPFACYAFIFLCCFKNLDKTIKMKNILSTSCVLRILYKAGKIRFSGD